MTLVRIQSITFLCKTMLDSNNKMKKEERKNERTKEGRKDRNKERKKERKKV